MVRLIEAWRSRGIPVFVFTNGTDRVPAELEKLGIAELFHGVLNSYNYRVRKPDAEAYRRAHAEIEAVLGRAVLPNEVYFTDDKAKNVDAARTHGWRAEVFESAAALHI
jgi:putative hydrolase of the HAD superfamily